MRQSLYKVCILVGTLLAVTIATKAQVIPEPVKVSLQGRVPTEKSNPTPWSSIVVNQVNPVFSTCEAGKYYTGFQLAYDLGDKSTATSWGAQVSIQLLHNTTAIWTRQLAIQMSNQNFVSTIFHDSTISCGTDYKYKVTVKTPTGTVPAANVELRVLLYKYDTASLSPSATTSLTCNKIDNAHISLSWNAVDKADEYDVEWVLIDSLEGFSGTDFFSKGAGGITTAQHNYDHQMFYPSGTIYHRVRAVGYAKTGPEHRIVGPWATCSSYTITNQEPHLIWQSQTVYAEDGRHKTSVKYFDPGMRERQALVNLSTNDMTVVGETRYDFEGRPSINILPVPVTGNDLTYKEQFNAFEVNSSLSGFVSNGRRKFNYDNGSIANTKMRTDSVGAARYYSPSNKSTITNPADPNYYRDLRKNFLPDANGYVYSQTEYMRDGRNVVAKQSGVGETFAMDGNHTTKYFYAQATQTELGRLFGTNAGNASHYKKQVTVDNNNQVSVAYLDQEGRTIATALAGKSPDNLDSLASSHIVNTLNYISSKNKKESSRSVMVHKISNTTIPTQYTFYDSLSAYGVSAGQFGCQSCSYNVTVTVTDPDGVQVASVGPRLISSVNSCSSPTNVNDISLDFIGAMIGDYTITKITTPVEKTYDEVKTIVSVDHSDLDALEVAYGNLSDQIDAAECKICIDPLKYEQAYEAIEKAQKEIADLDCQKLYNEMVRKWRTSNPSEPTLAQLQAAYSIAYDEWLICKKNVRSDVFDKQLGRIPNWTAATAAGYTSPLEMDPFFYDTLAGAGSVTAMRTKLDLISISPSSTVTLTGPIENITDPAMLNYYVDQNGRTDSQFSPKYHVLYYDVMANPPYGTDAAANAKYMDTARWVMFKNFYLEKKRLQKLDIFTNDSIRKRLQGRGLMDNDTEGEISAYIQANGAITSVQLDSVYNRLIAHCGVHGTASTVKSNLQGYFSSDPSNVFYDIFTEDLNEIPINSNLSYLKTSFGACLTTFARSKYECLKSITYYRRQAINNSTITKTGSFGSCPTTSIVSSCFSGWDSVSGVATTQNGELFLNSQGCTTSNTAASGTFAAPLIVGKTYRFRFQYKNPTSYPNEIRVQFGTSSSVYQSNTTTFDSEHGTTICAPQPLSISSDIGVPVLSVGISKTTGIYIPNSSPVYSEAIIRFKPASSGILYFFVDAQTNYGANNLSTAVLTDFILESEEEACVKYASINNFAYNANWSVLRDTCMSRAAQERYILLNRAKDVVTENKITEFYRYNCLDGLTENLSYQSTTREYHYTLYYYDQAGNLAQTVPPNGVSENFSGSHSYLTNYKYNSYNQVVSQRTPDAGLSEFWYNNKTQLRLSQNAQQNADSVYSYSKYDNLGRVIEVGEIISPLDRLNIPDSVEYIKFPLRSGNTLSDITWTYYDSLAPLIQLKFPQQNLRNRVSYTEVTDQQNLPGNVNNIRTYFSYDVHGNVKSLRQDVPGLPAKTIDYVYDLVSNKVNYVFFQFGKYSQFAHRYQYDADNRLTSVSTSTDRFIWNLEAKYNYYDHGPLARIELGEHRIQGEDYFYTLQGWLKGVNIPYSSTYGRDPGNDAELKSSLVGKDVTSFTLGYYNGDYVPIVPDSVGNTLLASGASALWSRWDGQYTPAAGGLYNGNISWMITDLAKQGELKSDRYKGVQAMLYKYDQLNRITQSRSLSYSSSGLSAAHPTTNAAYDEKFSYDPNGNLKTLDRWSDTGTLKDDFDYSYYSGTNSLYESHPVIQDLNITSGTLRTDDVIYRNVTVSGTASVAAGSTVELKAINSIQMSPSFAASLNSDFYAHIVPYGGTYEYDAIGNLISDHEKGTEITWTPQGKVRQVNVQNGLSITTFRYDAMGNRVEKKVVASGVTKITRYLRDATGNVLSVYNDTTMIEQPIYGSLRVGMYIGGSQDGKSIMNLRRYELTNHLGNVLSVISDKVTMTSGVASATVLSTSDYYPFGLAMTGRTWSDPSLNYRYGFNGKEKDADTEWGSTEYDYGFRIYNPSLGKFLSVDPLTGDFPMLTPYQFASNIPIAAIDLDGMEARLAIYGAGVHRGPDNSITELHEGLFKREADKEVALKNANISLGIHSGAVLVETLKEYTKNEGSIEYLHISSHASTIGLLIDNGQYGLEIVGNTGSSSTRTRAGLGYTWTNIEDISKSAEIKFASNALVIFAGCNTGRTTSPTTNKPIYSLAKSFAEITSVATVGAYGYTQPSGTNGERRADYEYRLFYKDENNNLQQLGLGKELNQDVINRAKSVIDDVANKIKQRNEISQGQSNSDTTKH